MGKIASGDCGTYRNWAELLYLKKPVGSKSEKNIPPSIPNDDASGFPKCPTSKERTP